MKKQLRFSKESAVILSALTLLALLTVSSKLYTYYQIEAMHTITTDLYEHPLKVSNAALAVQADIYKIRRDIREILSSPQSLPAVEADIPEQEQDLHTNLDLIRQNILGDEGLRLYQQTFRMVETFGSIRNELLALVRAGRNSEANAMFRGRGSDLCAELEASAVELNTYARKKADDFKERSDTMFARLEKIHDSITAVLLLLFGLIGWYTVNRVSGYIAGNRHLTQVLAMIRNVNQLIVREKEPQRLIQESCNLMTSSNLYDNAWIFLYDDADKVKFSASNTESDAFIRFKEKIAAGWTPGCIEKTLRSATHDTVTENTLQNCRTCPMSDQYEDNTAFTAALIHDGKCYGFMTLSIEGKYVKSEKETALLKEVASDIAYALYNHQMEQQILQKEERYREMVENMQSAVVVYRPQQEGHKFIIADLNRAAEKIESADKAELIGRDVEEAFPQIEAFGLLDVFKRVYRTGVAEKFALKEYRDERISGWRENYVYKLSSGEIVALYVDRSAEKRLEEELRQSEERYRFIIEATTDGIWDWDISASKIYFSPRWKTILGYRDDELENSFDEWESRLHPNDREQTFADITASQQKEPGLYKNVHRLQHKDGRWVWTEARGRTLFDDNGLPVRMIGSERDITKEKEQEEALKRSNDKFEKAFNHTPNVIIMTHIATGRIYEVNRTFEKIVGYKREEVIGKTTLEIGLWNDPKEREAYIAALKKNAAVDGAVYAFKTKTGVLMIAQVYSSLVVIDDKEYILAVAEDITEKQNYMNQLKQKTQELETIIQEAPNPIMLHNETGEVLMVNRVWEELTGYTPEEIDTVDKWMQKAYGKKMPQIKKVTEKLYAIAHKVDEGEFTIRTKNGDSIIWQFSSAPLGVIDGKRTVITSAMDISELKKKDELMMVQSRYAAMGEMIGMIAHQWRQPVSGIAMDANNMLLDIALGDFRADAAEAYAKEILGQTEHLSKTIDDFRNFFKPDKAVSKVKLPALIEETFSIVKESLANHNIEYKTAYASESEVNAYPRELMQVFVNIIHNAKDALTAKNVKEPLIEVRVYEDEQYVNTEICDNGGGIDSTILGKVFDPYFTTKDEKTGTGLGLYMSKMIIEEHLHGIIEASNRESGACFRVRLLKNRRGDTV